MLNAIRCNVKCLNFMFYFHFYLVEDYNCIFFFSLSIIVQSFTDYYHRKVTMLWNSECSSTDLYCSFLNILFVISGVKLITEYDFTLSTCEYNFNNMTTIISYNYIQFYVIDKTWVILNILLVISKVNYRIWLQSMFMSILF